MNIYLVRHGQTSWNRHQRLQGRCDIPLNRSGIRQSRLLAEWHRKTGVRRIVSSPLLRARRTAQILAERNGTAPLTDDRLREIDHGREYSPQNAAVSALTVMRRKIIGVEREVDVAVK